MQHALGFDEAELVIYTSRHAAVPRALMHRGPTGLSVINCNRAYAAAAGLPRSELQRGRRLSQLRESLESPAPGWHRYRWLTGPGLTMRGQSRMVVGPYGPMELHQDIRDDDSAESLLMFTRTLPVVRLGPRGNG